MKQKALTTNLWVIFLIEFIVFLHSSIVTAQTPSLPTSDPAIIKSPVVYVAIYRIY
ncbi:MAG: hypothetical protein LBC20_16995 [Planctomycetaceae bacterium]|nr:hypothetical protein [Planctomycetaceae bacterium]